MATAAAISPEVLSDRLKEGGIFSVKKFIETVPEHSADEQKERVHRAREALDLLRKEEQLKKFSEEERRAIIEASRQVIQNEIDTVSKELQKGVKDNIETLKQRQEEFLAAKEDVLEVESQLNSLAVRVGVQFRELGLNWRNSPNEVKAAIVAAAAVGGAAALWLWNKIWGDTEHPGFVRRMGAWAVGLGAAALSAVGMDRLLWSGGKAGALRGIAHETTEASKDAAKKIDLKETGENISQITQERSQERDALKKRYEAGELTDLEYRREYVWSLLKEGYALVVNAGVPHFYKSGKELLTDSLPNVVSAGAGTFEDCFSGRSLLRLYHAHMEGVYIYALSFGAVQGTLAFMQDGPLKGITYGVGKSLGWELELLNKGRTVVLGSLFPRQWEMRAAAVKELKNVIPYQLNRLRSGAIARKFNGTSMNKISDLIDEYKYYGDLRGTVAKLPGREGWFSAKGDLLKSLSTKIDAIGHDLRRHLFVLKEQTPIDKLEDLYTVVTNHFGKEAAKQLEAANSANAFAPEAIQPDDIIQFSLHENIESVKKMVARVQQAGPEALTPRQLAKVQMQIRDELLALKEKGVARGGIDLEKLYSDVEESLGKWVSDALRNANKKKQFSHTLIRPNDASLLENAKVSASAAQEMEQGAANAVEGMKSTPARATEEVAEAVKESTPQLRFVERESEVTDSARTLEGAAKAEQASKAAEEIAFNESKWFKQLAKAKAAGREVTLDTIGGFLKDAQERGAIKMNPETLKLIEESPSAKKIIVGAVQAETTDFAEVTRALAAANRARLLRAGITVLGAAGDLFGIYMAIADMQANGGRIENAKKTGNVALADMYAHANYLYGLEGAASAGGLYVGGVAVYGAVAGGETFLTALGTSAGGLVMLPVAAAVLSGGYAYRRVEGVRETWMRTAKDWVKNLTPGQVLEKLQEVEPGADRSFGDRRIQGTLVEQMARKVFSSRKSYRQWEEKNDELIEGGNTGARYELTKAYVIQSSAHLMPGKEGEKDDARNERFDRFVMDQMQFHTLNTQATFERQQGAVYQMGRTYAELMERSRDAQMAHTSDIFIWENPETGVRQVFDLKDFAHLSWGERQTMLMRYMISQKKDRVQQFSIMNQLDERVTGLDKWSKKEAVEDQLILDTYDDFIALDGRMESTDFEGTLGADARGRAVARLTVLQLVQNQLDKKADVIMQKAKKGSLEQSDYNNALDAIRGILMERDLLKYQRMGEAAYLDKTEAVQHPERTAALFNPQSLLQSLHQQFTQERESDQRRRRNSGQRGPVAA
ncbi:hypothetical protein COU76_05790 [Candidatus Peregrinibacteria bacterium CG10_big_fil_rev_8_21_14_0_10_49_10]|nr:MAG: hypothetical protein COU76_05790 [Candidatus Peregrinibacteria bacterium CG10_big_fil_rev_8_21_14_0_10_49_10]